jgi:dTDP-4-dehydrorhamnose 3,5-epimerase
VKFTETDIAGAYLLALEKRVDERGYFARVWCQEELRAHQLNAALNQINTGFSPRAGTLRGLHYQAAPHQEVKIVRCLRGSVFDVIVDLRPTSATFQRWAGFTLSAESAESLYVPEGCAHGYLTLSADTELMYFASVAYAPAAARGVRFDDPAFQIRWPRAIEVMSEADRTWPDFETAGAG